MSSPTMFFERCFKPSMINSWWQKSREGGPPGKQNNVERNVTWKKQKSQVCWKNEQPVPQQTWATLLVHSYVPAVLLHECNVAGRPNLTCHSYSNPSPHQLGGQWVSLGIRHFQADEDFHPIRKFLYDPSLLATINNQPNNQTNKSKQNKDQHQNTAQTSKTKPNKPTSHFTR